MRRSTVADILDGCCEHAKDLLRDSPEGIDVRTFRQGKETEKQARKEAEERLLRGEIPGIVLVPIPNHSVIEVNRVRHFNQGEEEAMCAFIRKTSLFGGGVTGKELWNPIDWGRLVRDDAQVQATTRPPAS